MTLSMIRLTSCLFAGLVLFIPISKSIAAPVVFELFTSEGCSSCPPADKVLSEFAENSPVEGIDIIPLGWHVDYWNRLGWTDRFSKEDHTRRQYAYAQASKKESVFTPEAVINGFGGINGSNRPELLRVAEYHSKKPNAEVRVTPTFETSDSLKIRVEVPREGPISEESSVDVVVLITEDNLTTEVKRGENSGRTLTHDAVVRMVKPVATLQKPTDLPMTKEVTLDWNPEWVKENCHAVVLLQERYSLLILGAGTSRVQEVKD